MEIILKYDEITFQTKSRTPLPFESCTIPTIFLSCDMAVEPIRKAVTQPVLYPKNFKLPVSASKNRLNKFLIYHSNSCTCDICRNPLFQMVSVQIGVIYARYYYITQDFNTAETFFKEALEWWNKMDSVYLKQLFRDISAWMIIYYINVLRRIKNYDQALKMGDISLNYYKEYADELDDAHFQNLLEQKTSIEYINKVMVKSVQNSRDKSTKELQTFTRNDSNKVILSRPLHIIQEGKIKNSDENGSDSKSCRFEENNNEEVKGKSKEKSKPVTPLHETTFNTNMRGKQSLKCESTIDNIDTSECVGGQTNLTDKIRNNQGRRRNFEKNKVNSQKTSVEIKGEENVEVLKITRSGCRRK